MVRMKLVDDHYLGQALPRAVQAGCPDEVVAELLFRAARAEQPAELSTYHLAGEAFELAGDRRRSHDWFTAGLLRALRKWRWDDPMTTLLLFTGRYRVRRALALPLDDLDELKNDLTATKRRPAPRGAGLPLSAIS